MTTTAAERLDCECEQLRLDAERWRALMRSDRLHWMGSSGMDLTDTPDAVRMIPGQVWHFGMEFWSEHPASGDPQYSDVSARVLITAYVDAMREKEHGK